EVITTPYTFTATISAILYVGAKPVLVDIEPNGFNIDIEGIEKAITPKTRAIIPVHFAGQACNMDAISEIARRYHLTVIEDAAHAIGARYGSRKIGAVSNFTSFSFYATKNMTSAEGGMITTNDDAAAEQMRSLCLHGLSRDAWKRYSATGSWFYEVLQLGYKYNLSDVHASIGLRQFAKLERFIASRQRIVDLYDKAFAGMPEIDIPPRDPNNRHAWHLYVIRLNTDRLLLNRAGIIKLLAEKGVGTSVHFIPVHLHPFYKDHFGWKHGDFPRAETTYERVISLPLYPQLEFMQGLNHVIDSVCEVIAQARR
ncbi:MAG TPA: DegT/DnrJ/EryC1/StrS family aminotransferase, partial [Terriglobia bacterium]|nr:DegT/DnrJ/EryC1/StrS family aminotransferase [Terriglobia bacterium]